MAQGTGRPLAGLFPYLRSFWPGTQNGLKAVLDNRWIGSRAQPAWGGLDVSDLERLKRGCAMRDRATEQARSLARCSSSLTFSYSGSQNGVHGSLTINTAGSGDGGAGSGVGDAGSGSYVAGSGS